MNFFHYNNLWESILSEKFNSPNEFKGKNYQKHTNTSISNLYFAN